MNDYDTVVKQSVITSPTQKMSLMRYFWRHQLRLKQGYLHVHSFTYTPGKFCSVTDSHQGMMDIECIVESPFPCSIL